MALSVWAEWRFPVASCVALPVMFPVMLLVMLLVELRFEALDSLLSILLPEGWSGDPLSVISITVRRVASHRRWPRK